MTPQELKNSILQLAIQGKLVEQRPEEGTAEELYREIQKEKQTLIKAGKIKKEKPLPEITEEELPFEIPESWKWVRLGLLIRVIGGVSYDKKDVTTSGYRILRGGNIQQMKVFLEDDDVFLPEQYKDDDKLIRAGDILVVASTGSKAVIGKAGYVDRPIPNTMIGAFLRICRPIQLSIVNYLRCLFDSDFYRKHIRELAQGTNINNVKESYITEFAIPLPPLAEQKRIVAKIEELLPLIDRYEKAWTRLEDFNKRFPGDMQKSILQMAIQGKLVEQRPEEGTGEELYQQILTEKQALIKSGKIKKEKPLPEITEEEVPFDIPESWKWVRLGAVVELLSGFAFKSENFKTKGKYRLLRGINLGVNEIRWKETVYVDSIPDRVSEYKLVKGDVLLGLDRPWISDGTRVAIYNDIEETYLVQRVLRIRGRGALTSDFVAYILHSSLLKNPLGGETTGISVPHISPNQVGNIVVPLPPHAEQKRIVARLEELLPLCEKLK